MKSFYSLGKLCTCGARLANQNKTNLCRKCYMLIYNEKHKNVMKLYYKEKYQLNKHDINKHKKWLYQNNVQFKLKDNLRRRLRSCIKGKKVGSAVKNLGCTVQELKIYLESKFQSGMTWENHGKFGWHIDHVRPLSEFDLTDTEQLKEACHYTNLQPLWWQDNLSKSNL